MFAVRQRSHLNSSLLGITVINSGPILALDVEVLLFSVENLYLAC